MKPTKEEIQKERAQQEADIVQCLKTLSAGGLILYPTDTVWGIGCDATNAEAVKKVYQLKQRDDSKALIVLIDSADHLDHYVVDVPMIARELIDVAVKPLTIIYEGAYNLATNVLGDQDSVGIRIPNDEFCHRLCERFGKPIVSTSANVSGAPTAKTFADIDASIVQGVDYAVQYRRDDHASRHPSNIILLSRDGTFKIIR
ncbi:MAG: threonylcarbamoyl-AMP synthase [Muribaculaceae bacterium]|jgi:L-threonylcarbamoyladenylate synthase|nr:threonylcarbamoyl-AMP synthase [Bacteroidales bacterium]MBQ1486666.1 threonylcarbamoyl-AMP synthase [Muribaculaceae bacterium]MBQ1583786.1 threonylcarbamoyl-AMP synthase [Muribaculaceae bacterium]MBQ1746047.1 threonylcarbamoyl-AMP synthase [Muribaculaceae bacterium]MBR0493329.1 threonylcarbamoyl-AMP synthase [Muribaculaceae bacterium]